jgi:hypothetical protein
MKTGPLGVERGADTQADTSDTTQTKINARKNEGINKPAFPLVDRRLRGAVGVNWD